MNQYLRFYSLTERPEPSKGSLPETAKKPGRTANDNNEKQASWSLVPFPEGWYAAC